MFYAKDILGKKAPLGPIWIAAHAGDRRLNKRWVMGVDVSRSCENIMNPDVPLALRVLAFLVNGVTIIHRRQQEVVLERAMEVLRRMRTKGMHGNANESDRARVGKKKSIVLAKYHQVTLDDLIVRTNGMRKQDGTYGGFQVERRESSWNKETMLDLFVPPSHLRGSDASFLDAEQQGWDEPERFELPPDFQHVPDEGFWTDDANAASHRGTESIHPSDEKKIGSNEEPTLEGSKGVSIPPECEPTGFEHGSKVMKKRKKKIKTLVMDDPESILLDRNTYRGWIHDVQDLLRTDGCHVRKGIDIEDLLKRPFSRGHTMCKQLLDVYVETMSTNVRREDVPSMEHDVPLEREEDGPQGIPRPSSSEQEIERLRRRSSTSFGWSDPMVRRPSISYEEKEKKGIKTPASIPGQDGRLSDVMGHRLHAHPDPLPDDPMVLLMDSEAREGGTTNTSTRIKPTWDEETYRDTNQDITEQVDVVAKGFLDLLRVRFWNRSDEIDHWKPWTLRELIEEAGLDRSRAARCFYHVCVLTSVDCIRIEQEEAYGDIRMMPGIRF